MKTPISDFFEKRMMNNKKIEEAFTTYVKASFADQFDLQMGNTVHSLVLKMTEEEVANYWNRFVFDFKDALLS